MLNILHKCVLLTVGGLFLAPGVGLIRRHLVRNGRAVRVGATVIAVRLHALVFLLLVSEFGNRV